MTARTTVPTSRWAFRLAGGLVTLVGAVLVLIAGYALLVDVLGVTPARGAGLIALGAVTVVGGVLVWRGSSITTYVALTVFGLLLLVQLTVLVEAGEDIAAEVVRLGVLAALVLALTLAVLQSRRRP